MDVESIFVPASFFVVTVLDFRSVESISACAALDHSIFWSSVEKSDVFGKDSICEVYHAYVLHSGIEFWDYCFKEVLKSWRIYLCPLFY